MLTLRPGAVGPVTPGADNPENPFAAGLPLVVITARDLVSDGALHTLEVELRGRTRTAQIDQLLFQLPAGAQLDVEALDFRAAPEVFPCAAGGPPLPADTRKLVASGELTCAAVPATSLRGRESIRIAGAGQKGGALYLSLLTNLAGVRASPPGLPSIAGAGSKAVIPETCWRISATPMDLRRTSSPCRSTAGVTCCSTAKLPSTPWLLIRLGSWCP